MVAQRLAAGTVQQADATFRPLFVELPPDDFEKRRNDGAALRDRDRHERKIAGLAYQYKRAYARPAGDLTIVRLKHLGRVTLGWLAGSAVYSSALDAYVIAAILGCGHHARYVVSSTLARHAWKYVALAIERQGRGCYCISALTRCRQGDPV